jgi:hypothetical protein
MMDSLDWRGLLRNMIWHGLVVGSTELFRVGMTNQSLKPSVSQFQRHETEISLYVAKPAAIPPAGLLEGLADELPQVAGIQVANNKSKAIRWRMQNLLT